MAITMKYIRNNKKIVISIFLIILIIVGISWGIKNFNSKQPFEGNITAVIITQEIKPDSIKVENVSEFVNKMKVENWKELKKFNLKSAPICYLELEPSGETIEIFMPDEEYAYACFDRKYYLIPLEAYEYIIDIIS